MCKKGKMKNICIRNVQLQKKKNEKHYLYSLGPSAKKKNEKYYLYSIGPCAKMKKKRFCI